jgi:hypothetical protein
VASRTVAGQLEPLSGRCLVLLQTCWREVQAVGCLLLLQLLRIVCSCSEQMQRCLPGVAAGWRFAAACDTLGGE